MCWNQDVSLNTFLSKIYSKQILFIKMKIPIRNFSFTKKTYLALVAQ